MSANTTIRISIVDDHPLVITGLQNMLLHYPHIQLLETYTDGDQLLNGLKQVVPDVLLLDIQLPGKTGEELAPLVLKKYPRIRILILTNFDSTLYANNMLIRGVHGYILKTAEHEVLIQAIGAVYAGEQFIEESMKEKMEQAYSRIEKRGSLKSSLTLREIEITQLIVDGKTNPEIAEKLFLSINTVDTYRTNIMQKLDVKNTAMLVNKALKMGYAK
jgi:DNA-binding NarL/FixJ family response regulator